MDSSPARIENAVGGSGDDVIVGSFGANRLEGGPGTDYIQGDDSGGSGTPGGAGPFWPPRARLPVKSLA